MDRYVIAIIHPFILEQEVRVYIGDECAQTISCTLETIVDRIQMLCDRYDINKVHFYGGLIYATKFKKQLISMYNNKEIDVEIH